MMVQTRNRAALEVVMVVLTLALGGLMLYLFLPLLTTSTQQVVPAPQAMDQTQLLVMLFLVATAIGAPITIGLVLALIFKIASPRVATSSSVAPEIPSPQAKSRSTSAPKEMSSGEARVWKVLAVLMSLAVAALVLFAAASAFTQIYH